MAVNVGLPAPDVEVEAYVNGEREPQKIKLSEYRDKWVVLFFYPRDFTFVCPTEIQGFAHLHEQFEEEDAVVLAASTDSFFSHKAWFESDTRLRKVPYPIIADTSHRLASSFDVLMPNGDALRGTFIIDPNGLIRHMTINDPDVGRSVEETLRTLRALRTGQLCPAEWKPGKPTLMAA